MLENSKDILNLVIGFSILWLALWLSWIFYQIGCALKKMNKTIAVVENIAKNIDEAVDKFKSKAGDMAAYMTVLAKGGKQIIELISRKKSEEKNKKKQK